MTSRRITRPLSLFALFTAIGLLFFLYRYLDDLSRALAGTALPRFIEEMTGAYSAIPIVPIAFGLSARFPWTRGAWPRALLAQAGGLVAYTLLHTTLMALSRAALFPLAGLGHYDYGIMLFRYPMEASNDVVFYAVACALAYYLASEERARRAELAAAELQGRLAQATLENLRLQLHPHFLFNSLNAISAVMYEDVARADAMLARLSEFLRTVLAASDVQQVPLDDELDVERMYLDVMTARLERALRFDVRVAPEARTALVPFLVLQPLLENAIRHGMGGVRETIAISVEVSRENGETVIAVADDGVGMREGVPRGHGLSNVAARLDALFGDGATFAVGAAPEGGTRATLRFPFAATGPA